MAPDISANLAHDAASLVMLAAEEAHSHKPTPVYDLVQALALVRAGTDIDWQDSYARQLDGIPFPSNHASVTNGETSGVCPVYRLQTDCSLTLEGMVTP